MSQDLDRKVHLKNPDGTPFTFPIDIVDGNVYYRPDETVLLAIRQIVREDLAALKKELAEDVLKQLATEIRLQAGMITANEARKQRGISDL